MTKQADSEFYCRSMLTDDIADVLEIERRVQIMPWSRLSIEESLTRAEQLDKTDQLGYFCRVLTTEQKVCGFSIVSSVADEMHILNLAIDATYQGRGLGHMLMHDVVDICEQHQLSKILLEVRASNEVAQSLYQKWQFKPISVRKNYYRCADQQKEDAVIMVRLLDR